MPTNMSYPPIQISLRSINLKRILLVTQLLKTTLL